MVPSPHCCRSSRRLAPAEAQRARRSRVLTSHLPLPLLLPFLLLPATDNAIATLCRCDFPWAISVLIFLLIAFLLFPLANGIAPSLSVFAVNLANIARCIQR